MSKHYTTKEREILHEHVFNGALVENICLMLPERSFNALRQKARSMEFGTKRIDGELVFVPIKRRKKADAKRTATKSSTSATEELSDGDIIAEKSNFEKLLDTFIQIENLVNDKSLGINNITVHFQNMTLSLNKETP